MKKKRRYAGHKTFKVHQKWKAIHYAWEQKKKTYRNEEQKRRTVKKQLNYFMLR